MTDMKTQAEWQDLDRWVGYFESPYQDSPSYDPGVGMAKCPVCNKYLLGQALKTVSLMGIQDERSYFFRVHGSCWDHATHETRQEIESRIIDKPEAFR